MKAKAEIPDFLKNHTPWDLQENPVWLASSFILQRNFSNSLFATKLEGAKLSSLLQEEKKVLEEVHEKNTLCFLPAEELSALDKEFLFEHFLCLEGFQNAGKGLGFAVENSGKTLYILNRDNHIEMHHCDFEGIWEKGFSHLSEIESKIGEKMPFAYSPHFGYLTADPTRCGTGLNVLIYLHIPALIYKNELEAILTKEQEDSILFTSLVGDIQNLVGDVLVLQNRYCLGVDEKTILRSLHTASMKLIGAEQLARSHSKEKNLPEIKDLVSRAFGLLTLSYQLEIQECLAALSLIKLGIDLGWIEGVSHKNVNDLFFLSRKAHLLFKLKEENHPDNAEVAHKRAAFIHEALSQAKLLITP